MIRDLLFAAAVLVMWIAPARSTTTAMLLGAKPCSVEAQQRPFVLLSRSHLDELREQTRPGNLKHAAYTSAVKENAERWIGRGIIVPERAGHFHDFACTDGTRFRTSADQKFDKPTTGPMQFHCPACGKVYQGEKFDAAMRHAEHTWLIAACRDLALAGALENRDDYLQKSSEILRKYADAYPGRHTSAIKGGIYYQSLDESVHFISLAQAYDLLCASDVLTEQDRNLIEQKLFWESAEGLIKCGLGGNWGSWHLSAVGVIGYATKRQRYIDYGLQGFYSQIENQLGADGLWPESVHTYHFYPMRAFLHLAEAATNSGTDLYQWEAEPPSKALVRPHGSDWDSTAGRSLRGMFTAPLRYMYPNFQLPAINDGWFHSYLPLDIYQVGFRRYNDSELLWAVQQLKQRGEAAKTKSPDAVPLWSLLHDQPSLASATAPLLHSTNFPVLGIAVLRQPPTTSTSATVLTFDYGRHLGHGQADKMGITLFANGKLLLADYGTPSYGSEILPYYKGTTSHNTIRLNGVDQRPTTDSKLLAFSVAGTGMPGGENIQIATAETDQVAEGVLWRRTVALSPTYALLLDDLVSSAPQTYDSFIHGEGAIVIGRGTTFGASTESLSLRYFRNAMERETDEPAASFRWSNSPADHNLTMLVASKSPKIRHFIVSAPAETGTRLAPVVMSRAEGESLFLATLLYFGPHGENDAPPKLEITTEGVKVTTATGAHLYQVASGLVNLIEPEGSKSAATPAAVSPR